MSSSDALTCCRPPRWLEAARDTNDGGVWMGGGGQTMERWPLGHSPLPFPALWGQRLYTARAQWWAL